MFLNFYDAYLFLQIASNKWEQNHIVPDAPTLKTIVIKML